MELRNCNCRKNPFLFLEYSISKLRLTPLPGSYERTVPTPSRPSLILCHGMEPLLESEAVPPAYLSTVSRLLGPQAAPGKSGSCAKMAVP